MRCRCRPAGSVSLQQLAMHRLPPVASQPIIDVESSFGASQFLPRTGPSVSDIRVERIKREESDRPVPLVSNRSKSEFIRSFYAIIFYPAGRYHFCPCRSRAVVQYWS